MDNHNIKKLKKSFCICLFAILTILSFNFIFQDKTNIENKWNINLPSKLTLKYKNDNVGWFGEGERYYLYINKNDKNFVNDFTTNTGFIKKCTQVIISKMNIPKKYLPNWNLEFKGKLIGNPESSHLCLIYFMSTCELLLCEMLV